eukprot:TRINITY_DN1159_c0_g1_i11.p1 TRINITY_DN1159_c0_g1~~TRINITY_DN1159_c0_g1_i11.p1  ORF type:complete len:557 (-),score=169.45 TRINITY_DN1159_c0_g1_i11:28-1698(-)
MEVFEWPQKGYRLKFLDEKKEKRYRNFNLVQFNMMHLIFSIVTLAYGVTNFVYLNATLFGNDTAILYGRLSDLATIVCSIVVLSYGIKIRLLHTELFRTTQWWRLQTVLVLLVFVLLGNFGVQFYFGDKMNDTQRLELVTRLSIALMYICLALGLLWFPIVVVINLLVLVGFFYWNAVLLPSDTTVRNSSSLQLVAAVFISAVGSWCVEWMTRKTFIFQQNAALAEHQRLDKMCLKFSHHSPVMIVSVFGNIRVANVAATKLFGIKAAANLGTVLGEDFVQDMQTRREKELAETGPLELTVEEQALAMDLGIEIGSLKPANPPGSTTDSGNGKKSTKPIGKKNNKVGVEDEQVEDFDLEHERGRLVVVEGKYDVQRRRRGKIQNLEVIIERYRVVTVFKTYRIIFVVFVRDVTQSDRIVSRAKETMGMQNMFVQKMAREISLPLNNLTKLANRLSDSTLTKAQRQYVDGVADSALSMNGIVESLTDFLDMHSEEDANLQVETFDVVLFAEEILESVSEFAFEHNVRLHSVVQPKAQVLVCTDRMRLKKVLMYDDGG